MNSDEISSFIHTCMNCDEFSLFVHNKIVINYFMEFAESFEKMSGAVGLSSSSSKNDLHEILKENVSELITAFKKPGAYSDYVISFWKLHFIGDDTKDDLLDSTSEADKGVKLHTTLYKSAKSNAAKWQLSLITFLLKKLESNEEHNVIDNIHLALNKRQIQILPPATPIPETGAGTNVSNLK